MVSVELPVGVFGAVVTLSVEVPDPVMDDGANDGVAFAGSPVTFRLTVPANPLNAPIVTV